jgi:hypothetical protein
MVWLTRSSSTETRAAYTREFRQFLHFVGIVPGSLEQLIIIRPHQITPWRVQLREDWLSNVAILPKITVLRS